MIRTASDQDRYYQQAIDELGPALGRLAAGYERDPHRREDLLQDIHLELWRSFARFEGRCSLRTWVYRVAHNIATTYVTRERRRAWGSTTSLEAIGDMADPVDAARNSEHRLLLERMMELIHALRPLDRQVMLLYLEGLDAASIGEIAGMTPAAVSTKVHRIRKALARDAESGG